MRLRYPRRSPAIQTQQAHGAASPDGGGACALHGLAAATPASVWSGLPASIARLRPRLHGETLIAGTSLYFAAFDNGAFWRAAVDAPLQQAGWIASLAVLVFAANAVLLSALVWRWLAKPVVAALLLVSALASHYSAAYGVHIDADMIGNVLHTDLRESSEFLSRGLLLSLLSTAPALLVLWRIRVLPSAALPSLVRRLVFVAVVGLAAILAAFGSSRELSALIRNHREVRYLVAPANVLVSSLKLATEHEERGPRFQVAGDAHLLPRTAGAKPRLLLIVVGETARAANWGLSGYARQTTPELARTAGVVNFADVTACGSSTEVALPCMFSIQGREHYDSRAIRSHESLLHVLARTGVSVLWRDNQSGCKGVCDGLPVERLDSARDPAYCDGLRCRDGILFADPAAWWGDGTRDRVVVLHMLGNHGPNYSDRAPPEFRRYQPVCASADLGDCSREQIVNAYDNALLYTDHLLASAIDALQAQSRYDAALLYVSDHGESLGENGLYLHGMPWPVAPEAQLRVPMIAWLSPAFAAATHLDTACLADRAAQPLTHDHLFHSVMGALGVASGSYRRDRDLFADCRPAAATASATPGTAK